MLADLGDGTSDLTLIVAAVLPRKATPRLPLR